MASYNITQKALAILAAEEQQKRMEEQQSASVAAAEAAAKAEAERAERVRLQAERELARIAAERALAEQAAAEARAAEAVALQAELARLRARSGTDVLREEMAQMRAEIGALKARPMALLTPPPQQEIHLRADGELDMRFKSSKEELATARAEIAELKALVRSLCISTMKKFRDNTPPGFYQNHCPVAAAAAAHLDAAGGLANALWQGACDEANAFARAMPKK